MMMTTLFHPRDYDSSGDMQSDASPGKIINKTWETLVGLKAKVSKSNYVGKEIKVDVTARGA